MMTRFPLGCDEAFVGNLVAGVAPVLQRQVLHGQIGALEGAARHVELPGHGGAAAEADGVELAV